MRYKTCVVSILSAATERIKQGVFLQLLMIMANSINYLTTRANFTQVSSQVPITKQRNQDKFDPPDVFEGMLRLLLHAMCSNYPGAFVHA